MVQSLWYLRQAGRVLGPFPTPRIMELLELGEVTPDWEVSLDEKDWLSIAESGQFKRQVDPQTRGGDQDTVWREERLKARQRWQGDDPGVAALEPGRDDKLRVAVLKDHVRTDALLEAQKRRRTPLVAPLLAMLALLVVGVVVWQGQREKPIRADIGAVPDCAAKPREGLNWTGCDKRHLDLSGLAARNGRLDNVRLDDSRLAAANLTYGFMRNASLRNVELAGASLLGADLTGADLTGADLTGADLRYAVLRNASLSGARLDGAQLDKATWTDGRVCAEGSLGGCQ